MKTEATPANPNGPLQHLEEWEEFLKTRYPEPATAGEKPFQATDPAKEKKQFRNYEADARPSVREFYRLNHQHQTYDFVQAKKKEYLGHSRRTMGIWEAMEFLNTLVPDRDEQTSQLESLRLDQVWRYGHPRWFILTG
jgi:inositol oxygenase